MSLKSVSEPKPFVWVFKAFPITSELGEPVAGLLLCPIKVGRVTVWVCAEAMMVTRRDVQAFEVQFS
jgi:hypothetical protein